MNRFVDIKWVGTPPPGGQGTFALVDGKRVGGVLPSTLSGMSQRKPFMAMYGEWLDFLGFYKTLDEAKRAVETWYRSRR